MWVFIKTTNATAIRARMVLKGGWYLKTYMYFSLIIMIYSKHPRIRTPWFKNLQAEIGHFNTQVYKNLFRLAKNNRFLYKKTLLFCSQNTGF